MPPIPIHRDAPIHPRTSSDSDSKPSSSTTATKPTQDYTPASHPQTANPPPTRTTPAYTPATTTQTSDPFSPPAPQPGAVPIPPSFAAPTSSASSNGIGSPPAPQPGAAPTPTPGYTATHTTTVTHAAGPPPQFTIPPPTTSYLPTHSTSPHPAAQASPYQHQHTGGAVLPPPSSETQTERRSLEHPPGYVQAADHYPGGYQGPGASGGVGTGAGEEGEGITDTAWNLLSKAGEALKKGEEAAWRAVRNKG